MIQAYRIPLLFLITVTTVLGSRAASAQIPKPSIKTTMPSPSGNISPVTNPGETRPAATGVTTTNLPDGVYKVFVHVYNYDREVQVTTEGTVTISGGTGTALIQAEFPEGYDCQLGGVQIFVISPDGSVTSSPAFTSYFRYGSCP